MLKGCCSRSLDALASVCGQREAKSEDGGGNGGDGGDGDDGDDGDGETLGVEMLGGV